jgi:hypothetical protein
MDKPSGVLKRFKIKLNNSAQSERITGKCFCTKKAIEYLCWQRMKIKFTRYTPAKKDTDTKKRVRIPALLFRSTQ